MDRRDIITFFAALVVVSIVAIVAHPAPAVQQNNPPAYTPDAGTPPPAPSPSAASGQTPPAAEPCTPCRILFEKDFLKYPVYLLPANLSLAGGSDLIWRTSNISTFAYVEGVRGGVTQTFSVPYPVWRLNCTVYAETAPQYAHFRMAVVDAETGTIVEGAEIRYPGSICRNVHVGGKEFYIIVGADHVDRYRITLETPHTCR